MARIEMIPYFQLFAMAVYTALTNLNGLI